MITRYNCPNGHEIVLSDENGESFLFPDVIGCPLCSESAARPSTFRDDKDKVDSALLAAWRALDHAKEIARSVWPSRVTSVRIDAIMQTVNTLRDYTQLMREN